MNEELTEANVIKYFEGRITAAEEDLDHAEARDVAEFRAKLAQVRDEKTSFVANFFDPSMR
jgi:ABC-type cobalamin transport system ATPase subunit